MNYPGECCYESYNHRDDGSHAHDDEDYFDAVKHGNEGGQVRHSQCLRFMRDLTGLILIYVDPVVRGEENVEGSYQQAQADVIERRRSPGVHRAGYGTVRDDEEHPKMRANVLIKLKFTSGTIN